MLAPLKTLFETKRGKQLPLPPRLMRLYGCLRMPLPRSRPHVFSNFVTTLDGVVSLNTKGHASGGDISGFVSLRVAEQLVKRFNEERRRKGEAKRRVQTFEE